MRLLAVQVLCAVVVLGLAETIANRIDLAENNQDFYEDDEDDVDVLQVEYDDDDGDEKVKNDPSATRRDNTPHHERKEHKTDVSREGSWRTGGIKSSQADDLPPDAENLKPGDKPTRVVVEGDIIVDKKLNPHTWKKLHLSEDNDKKKGKEKAKEKASIARPDHTPYHEGQEHRTDLREGRGKAKGRKTYKADDNLIDAESLKPGDVIPSRLLIEGDIIVDRFLDPDTWKLYDLLKGSAENAATKAVVVGPNKKTWPGGIVPFYIHESRMGDEAKILSAIQEFENATCLKFPRVTNHTLKNYTGKHFVNITKGPGAASYLGRIAAAEGQLLFLHDGFLRGNLIHELMHCVGFLHEHSRNDRKEYVKIDKHMEYKYNFATAGYRKLTTDDFGIPYDYFSITHYPEYSLTTIDTHAHADTGQRINLSVGDICQVNRLYGCYEKLDQLNLKCDCIDSYSKKSCFADKKEGLCNKDIPRMSVVCPETCGLCCQSNCTVKFSKQGCFQDAVVKNEIMKNRLHFMSGKRSEIPAENSEWVDLGSTDTKNENKRSRIVSPNIWVEWAQEGHLTKVVCTCAKKAKAAGMRYFAVRFPGECYGGKGKYYAEGISNKCRDQNFEECVYSNTKCCTGAHSGRFVYKLDQDNVLPLKRWGDVGPN
uniref:Metalloendopeptidase n=1 Tax=Isarachnanthus nocturnus TaxID=1240238 RepID=A0A7G7WYS5_9CNID|nr:toxin candidate TRINITY_DN20126_c1_g1_i4 [Isarachnanthus nocturnus]